MAKPPPPLFCMKGEMSSVHSLAYKLDDDRSLLFAGTQTGHVHVWDLRVNRECAKFSAGDDPILSIHCVNSRLLITQSKIGNVGIWEEIDDQWTLKQSLPQAYLSFCKSVIGSLNGEWVIACADSNSVIQVLSLTKYNVVLSLKNENAEEKLGEVMALKFVKTSEKKLLLSIYESCSLFLWDVSDKKVISKVKISEECPMALDFDESSMRGLCGSSDDNLVAFKLDAANCLIRKAEIKLTNPGVSSIKIRPDNKIVAVGCWEGTIRILSWRSLKLLAVLDHHDSTIHEICFSIKPVISWKAKILMAAGSKDGKISIWDLYNE